MFYYFSFSHCLSGSRSPKIGFTLLPSTSAASLFIYRSVSSDMCYSISAFTVLDCDMKVVSYHHKNVFSILRKPRPDCDHVICMQGRWHADVGIFKRINSFTKLPLCIVCLFGSFVAVESLPGRPLSDTREILVSVFWLYLWLE